MLELPDLAIGSPTVIGVPGFPQVGIRESVKTASGIEAGSDLIGDRFIVDKPVCVRSADCLLVQAHGVEFAAFDARDLCSD